MDNDNKFSYHGYRLTVFIFELLKIADVLTNRKC